MGNDQAKEAALLTLALLVFWGFVFLAFYGVNAGWVQ